MHQAVLTNSTQRPHAKLSRFPIIFHNAYMPLWHNKTGVIRVISTVRDSSCTRSTLKKNKKYRMAVVAYWSNAKTVLSMGQYGICVQWTRTTLYLSSPLPKGNQVPLGERQYSVWSSVVWIHIMFLSWNLYNVKAFAFFKPEKFCWDSTTNIVGSFLSLACIDRILNVVVMYLSTRFYI